MNIDNDETHPGTAARIPLVAAAREFKRQLFLAQGLRDNLSRSLVQNEASYEAVACCVGEISLTWSSAKSALAEIGKLAVDQHGHAVFEHAKCTLMRYGDTLKAVLHRTSLWANGTPLHQGVRQLLDDNFPNEKTFTGNGERGRYSRGNGMRKSALLVSTSLSRIGRWFRRRCLRSGKLKVFARRSDVPRLALAAKPDRLALYPLLVSPTFDHTHYLELWWTLQAGEGRSMLLDLTRTKKLRPEFFKLLAARWLSTASGRRTRLGIRLTFRRWVSLRDIVAPYIRELSGRGVDVQLFYEEQDHLRWFLEGEIVHNVEAVITKLSAWPQSSLRWPEMLDAAASLLGDHRRQNRCAEPLIELAQIAVNRGLLDKAVSLVDEALHHMREERSVLKCRALRILGLALLMQDQGPPGISVLEDAIAMAQEIGATGEAVDALFRLGQHALRGKDYTLAESRFRKALVFLSGRPSELLATVHDGLAATNLGLGRNEQSEWHAKRSRSVLTRILGLLS